MFDSIKNFSKVNLRIHEFWAVATQIDAIKDQILECLFKLCLPNEDCSLSHQVIFQPSCLQSAMYQTENIPVMFLKPPNPKSSVDSTAICGIRQ